MSRICDFCYETEDNAPEMAEATHGVGAMGLPKVTRHICLDCAKQAVARMEEMKATRPGGE